MALLEKMKFYAPMSVRYGVGIVFLLFGISQITDPSSWLGYLPVGISNYIVPTTFILFNGVFDLTLGILLLLGLFTRIVSAIAVLHLLGILATLGYNEVSIRDFGLMLGALSVFLNGPDMWCVDRKVFRRYRD
ncbi:MAG: DoxX family membrane protein [Nanoarchaeota archaeon]|nr:DoxX family membrane protein [Nanoarchaeota archaeon]